MTRPRVLLAAPLGVVLLSGCFFLFGNPADKDKKTYETAKELLARGDYAATTDELLRLNTEYQLDTRSPGYRSLTKTLIDKSFTRPAEDARRGLNGSAQSLGTGIAGAAQAIDAADRLLKLPLGGMPSAEYSPDTIRAQRDKLVALIGEKRAVFDAQVATLNKLEDEGKPLLAFIGWYRFIPAAPEHAKLREEKLRSTGAKVVAASAATFYLDAAPGASDETRAAVARARNQMLASDPGIRFLDAAKGADIALLVKAGQMKVTHNTGKVTLDTKVAVGKEMAENYAYKSLSRDLARWEKEAQYYQRRYSAINCNRGQARAPAGPCGKSEYSSLQNFTKKVNETRAKLAKTPAQKMQTKWETRNYVADSKEVVADVPLDFEVTRAGAAPQKLNVPSRFAQQALTHPAYPALKIPARADTLVDDATARKNAVANVEKTLVQTMNQQLAALRQYRLEAVDGKVDKQLERERLYERDLANQTEMRPWDPDDAFRMVSDIMGAPVADATRSGFANAYWRAGNAMWWERLHKVAEMEAAAQHLATAHVLTYALHGYDDESEAARKAALQTSAVNLRSKITMTWACTMPAEFTGYEEIQKKVAQKVIVAGSLRFTPGNPKTTLKCAIEPPPMTVKHTSQAIMLTAKLPAEPGETPEEVSYPATEDTYAVDSAATVHINVDDRATLTFTMPVTAAIKKVSYPENEEAGVEAHTEGLPSEQEVKQAWAEAATRAFILAVLDRMLPEKPDETPAKRADRLLTRGLMLSERASVNNEEWRAAFIDAFQFDPSYFFWKDNR